MLDVWWSVSAISFEVEMMVDVVLISGLFCLFMSVFFYLGMCNEILLNDLE